MGSGLTESNQGASSFTKQRSKYCFVDLMLTK